ncbi:MAG TPA: lysozyme [Candidatus Angelobacter sp.]|nr:lysozyme [Candidatus Angelobacter sp.]
MALFRSSGSRKAGAIAIAVSLIGGFEGLYTHAYRDVVGVKTVCYGHIEGVQMGDSYTEQECKDMLADDLPKYDAQVMKCIHVEMPPHRHAAILSFTYNVGGGALCHSSVARYLNAGNVKRGCDALLQWDRAGGRVIRGLHNRRVKERAECLRND